MVEELWQPLTGYEGLYSVSNMGNIRNDSGWRRGSILKPMPDKAGYCRVNVYKGGKMTHKLVHRLVAEAFVPNPANKPEVNHKDGNKCNNAAENLEWVTPKENVGHSIANGLRNNRKPVDMYTLDGEFIRTFESITAACEFCGALAHNISRCCAGKKGYDTARGYKWKYHYEGENKNV